jgi:type VI secretion system protein ImpL
VNFLHAHRRWLIGAFVVLALACVVWFAGPLLAFGERHPLDGVLERLLFVLLLVLVWLGAELARVLLARRRNKRLLEELSSAGADDSVSKEEAELLARRFREALDTLKGTKLGGQGGAKLLYQLPWYMFIGAPGSGKTTALVNSGLRFPLAKAGASASALGGIGGTRNCDWWFTDDAVLIDTAGRYTTQDSNSRVDQSAWQTFLQLLKKYRPRQPINGIFVTLSIGDLLSYNAAERAQYAQVVRQRVEDLQQQLGLQFPVYVMVTKCDLISGFDEFFATLDAEQRAQVWGVTLGFDLKKREPESAKDGFDAAMPGLVDKLNHILLERLQEERDPERRAQMYPFPQQFAAVGPLVSEFLDGAFGTSKYAGKVIVRGVYFTSGTQQGATIDRLLGALTQSLDLRGGGARRAQPAGAGKSFFIQRLMTDVVFPEAGLAGFSEEREVRLTRLNWGLAAGSVALAAGLGVAWTFSFFANKDGLARAGAAAGQARTALAAVEPPRLGDLAPLVEALNAMRRVPAAVHDPVDDPRTGMTWGLYQGDAVQEQVGERYRHALQQGLMPRIALQLEAVMTAPEAQPQHVYAALKTYLMMYDGKRLEREWFVGAVTELWRARFDPALLAAARAHLETLVNGGDLLVARFHPRNDAIVTQARERIARSSIVDRAYELLRLSGAGSQEGLRLSEVLGASGVGIFERASGVPLTEPISAIYTRQGYRKLVRPRIDDIVATMAAEESWVLGPQASGVGKTEPAQIALEVQRRYFADFQNTWDAVLADVRLRRIDGVAAALNAAQVLSQADSPLKRLVTAVADVTRLTVADVQGAAQQAVVDNVKQKAKEAATSATTGIFGAQAGAVVGTALPADASRRLEAQAEERFAGLRRLVGDGKTGEIDAAIALIAQVATELVAMQQKVSSGQGIKEVPAGLANARASADRFAVPVSSTIKGLVGFAEQEASGGVKKEVQAGLGGAASMCKRAIPGRYPFVRTAAQDTGVQDFVNVFKSGGDLDAFFTANLAPFIDKSGTVWQLKAAGTGGPPVSKATLQQFQNADAIRTAFLGGGAAPQVQADIAVVSGDAEVLIDYDGTQHRLRAGAPGVRLAWPARPGARLSIGGSPVVTVEGAWALFRLVDKGVVDPASSGDKVRVSYAGASGAKVMLEIRTGSAAFNPFRLRELTAFNCPQE